jgi:DNA-binding response OmpR family regulator
LPLKGRNVLLVEDDADVMDAMRDLLTAWGCKVDAHSGLPDQMRVGEYDLLITDFDLGGGVTGEEVVAAARTQMGGDLPVLILTGHDESKVRQMPDHAAITVLKKPIRPAQLRSTISTLLLHSKNAVS